VRVFLEGATGSGDPCCFDGYLFVPVPPNEIAILRATDLSLVATASVSPGTTLVYPRGSGDRQYLCSIDSIPTSAPAAVTLNPPIVRRFQFSWQELASASTSPAQPITGSDFLISSQQLMNAHKLEITEVEPLKLEGWTVPSNTCGGSTSHTQAAKFSPDGRMFYLFFGGNCDPCGNPDDCGHGIQAFEVDDTGTIASHIRASVSSNPDSLFFCEFHEADSCGQEPEGLTICDLDDGRAPGISGQLHVLIAKHCGHILRHIPASFVFALITNPNILQDISPSFVFALSTDTKSKISVGWNSGQNHALLHGKTAAIAASPK
jgi:hypothetical protein